MKTTDIGREAESAAALFLENKGYSIVARNWRTRWCEIDLVAKMNEVVYFVEVKYRKCATWGDGLEAVTPKKLQQMTFAAEMWAQAHQHDGDYVLMVASVTGNPPKVLDCFEVS